MLLYPKERSGLCTRALTVTTPARDNKSSRLSKAMILLTQCITPKIVTDKQQQLTTIDRQ